ncbi:hypothetical protein A3J41_00475 [candidate division TM6 bacterium RIFCSPHIGHO2_12_FULL_38_8]|nr:MAG: hypothetical protein A3J41_00475 [candidate division TM6 bacterium RIFCSPHIGHO2_12_FULL_38_8]
MKPKDITKFLISDKKYLKISSDKLPIEKLRECEDCLVCTNINVTYVDDENNINIPFGVYATGSFMSKMALSDFLQKRLEGKAIYDKNISGDLGFLSNQSSEGLLGSFPEFEHYFMDNAYAQTGTVFQSWLYNDTYGNIIFEITPFYPWNDPALRKDPRRITYKKFMKNYKPILQTIIPKKNIRQWIKQGKELNKLWFNE